MASDKWPEHWQTCACGEEAMVVVNDTPACREHVDTVLGAKLAPLGIVTSNFGDVVNAKATASWTDEEIDRLGNSGKTEIVVNQDDD